MSRWPPLYAVNRGWWSMGEVTKKGYLFPGLKSIKNNFAGGTRNL